MATNATLVIPGGERLTGCCLRVPGLVPAVGHHRRSVVRGPGRWREQLAPSRRWWASGAAFLAPSLALCPLPTLWGAPVPERLGMVAVGSSTFRVKARCERARAVRA